MTKRSAGSGIRRAAFCLALAVIGAEPTLAQDEPGFDCAKAKTPVEHVLCSKEDDTLAWLDRTLARLYEQTRSAPGADVATLTVAQRRWLVTRDSCHGDAATLRACLRPLYWRRIDVLTAPADPRHLTGLYRNPAVDGTLRAIRWPDGSVSVDADSESGPPRSASCSVSATGKPVGGRLICEGEACTGVVGCVITMTAAPGRFTISSSRCPGLCGMGARIDGVYTAAEATRR